MDNGLTGADTIELAITIQRQLQTLFSKCGFTLRKWNSNQPAVLQEIPEDLRESKETLAIMDVEHSYAKTLGVYWNTVYDITIEELPPLDCCQT